MTAPEASRIVWKPTEVKVHQPEYLDTVTTSKLTGISKSTLEKWRVYGGGIPFIKAGRSVKYALGDVHQWMANRRVASTSEPLSAVLPGKSPPSLNAE